MKHTPGEWKVEEGASGFGSICVIEKSPDRSITVYSAQRSPMEDEYLPNAHLIAAAPDLLEAAKAFVAWADDVWGSAALGPQTLAEYEAAKAAIRKARGESPEDER